MLASGNKLQKRPITERTEGVGRYGISATVCNIKVRPDGGYTNRIKRLWGPCLVKKTQKTTKDHRSCNVGTEYNG